METLGLIWFFLVGAALGSFLNVVVYRLPAGQSLSWPPSHCPRCQTRIRWYDNIPILAWFLLRGRCRACRQPIAFRYPLVEAACALLCLALAAVEFVGRGANLPERPVAVVGGVITPSLDTPAFLGLTGYHLFLLLALLAAALIEHDGQRLPRALAWTVLAVGLVPPLFFPELRPVPVWLELRGAVAGLLEGVAGALAGMAAGWLAWRAVGPAERRGVVAMTAAVGAFLGYQAALAIGATTLVLHAPMALLRRAPGLSQRIPPTATLGVVALVWIILWSALVARWPLLGLTLR